MGEHTIFTKIAEWLRTHKIKKLFCEHTYHFIGWEGRGDGAYAAYVCEKCGKLIDIEKHNNSFN